MLGVVSQRLAKAIDDSPGDPPVAVARELRQYVRLLCESPNKPASKVDEIMARRAGRRVGYLLGTAGGSA